MWNLERYKENIALYLESGETISYQQIAQNQKEIGSVLRGRTVAVLVCRNTLGCILCYLSLMRKDIVPLLLPSNLEEQEVQDVLLQSSSNNENTLFQRYCNWILQQNCNKFVCNNA